MPQSFVDRMERLKLARGFQSDSELIRSAIDLLEQATHRRMAPLGVGHPALVDD